MANWNGTFYFNNLFIAAVKPDAPEAPKPDRITKDSVTISWRPPRSDGGAKIKGYIIQKKAKGDDDWSDVNGTLVPTNVFKVLLFIAVYSVSMLCWALICNLFIYCWVVSYPKAQQYYLYFCFTRRFK
jgi:hypothetical protein